MQSVATYRNTDIKSECTTRLPFLKIKLVEDRHVLSKTTTIALHTSRDMGHFLKVFMFTCMTAVASGVPAAKTTCFAPPAYLGEPGSLTCYFPVDVTANKLSFNVRRVDRHDFDYNRDTVLDCDFISGDQLCLTINDGFTYDYQVSSRLTIIIPKVTLEHQGLYTCRVMRGVRSDPQSCSLTVSERKHSPRPGDRVIFETIEATLPTTLEIQRDIQVQGAEMNIAAIVVPVVIGLVLIGACAVVVYMCKRRIKKKATNTDGDDESEAQNQEGQPLTRDHIFTSPERNSGNEDDDRDEDCRKSGTSSDDEGTDDGESLNDPYETHRKKYKMVMEEIMRTVPDQYKRQSALRDLHNRFVTFLGKKKGKKSGMFSDIEGTEDGKGLADSKKSLKKKFKPVVEEQQEHNEDGEDILCPVSEEFKRKDTPRNLQNRIKAFIGKKKGTKSGTSNDGEFKSQSVQRDLHNRIKPSGIFDDIEEGAEDKHCDDVTEENDNDTGSVRYQKDKPVVVELQQHNEDGVDILRPVQDQYKSQSAQRDVQNPTELFETLKDIEEEAEDKHSANGDDVKEQNDDNTRSVRYRKYKKVVGELQKHNEDGVDTLRPVPDRYKRQSARQNVQNHTEPFETLEDIEKGAEDKHSANGDYVKK